MKLREHYVALPASIILNPTIILIIQWLRAITAIIPKRNTHEMRRAYNVSTIFNGFVYFYPFTKLCSFMF